MNLSKKRLLPWIALAFFCFPLLLPLLNCTDPNSNKEPQAENAADAGKEAATEVTPETTAEATPETTAEATPETTTEVTPETPLQGTELRASLSGLQESPSVATTAKGGAKITVSSDKTRIAVEINATGLQGVDAAHIHLGEPGENGPVIFGLASSAFTDKLIKTLTEADFQAQAAKGITTFAQAADAVLQGRTYINIHTAANPAGELRGQIGPVKLASTIVGFQENPMVFTKAYGFATIAFDRLQEKIDIEINATNLKEVDAAHIHLAPLGENGPVIFGLAAAPFTDKLTKSLTKADFQAQAAKGVTTFEDAVSAIFGGQTYINIHTKTHAPGEIRGQIGSIVLKSTLRGSQEVPAVKTNAKGSATLRLNATHERLDLVLNVSGLNDVESAHIHLGDPSENGPVIFGLASQAFTGSLTKTLLSADLAANEGKGIKTFQDAIRAVLSGRTYLNVHTKTHAGGEIRGQVGPAVFFFLLDGTQEVPLIDSKAVGFGLIRLSEGQETIHSVLNVENLQGIDAAHIHLGPDGVVGPVIFGLADRSFTMPYVKVVKVSELIKQPNQGINANDDAVNALLSRQTYVNIHTAANPGGEVRGQVISPVFRASLSGLQELPSLDTAASGTATVRFTPVINEIEVTLDVKQIQSIDAAHIHVGEAGENGPVAFGLASQPFTGTFVKLLKESDLAPLPPAAGITKFSEALVRLSKGQMYINIHTAANPSGELRGQLGRIFNRVVLSGQQEVTVNASPGKGGAAVFIDEIQERISVALQLTGVQNITAAHIHVGNVGENGPVIFDLATATFAGSLTVTLTSEGLKPAAAQKIATFQDAIHAILQGRTYINVHTQAFPGGEVRGQIGAARLSSSLDGLQEVPPVVTTAKGTARVSLSSSHQRIHISLEQTGIAKVDAAHIHAGTPLESGPVIFPVAAQHFTKLDIFVTESDFSPAPSKGIASYQDAINSLLSGLTYFNLHTAANPAGEIRGQIKR